MTNLTLQAKLPKVRGEYRLNEELKKHTWLNAGGAAEVMFLPEDVADLQLFLQQCPSDIPLFVIGNGSNLLVRDGGIKGVVIKLAHKNFADIRFENGLLYCGAGLKNSALKKILPQYQIGGLEFICSIPGCLGGAVRSNAGCFGSDISKVLQSARIINRQGEIKEVLVEDFNFSYRNSSFPSDWIVLELRFKTEFKCADEIISLIDEHNAYRTANQPQNVRTAGSTFKNPQGYRAWELIKNSGAAELKVGGAYMSPKHCNFLINDGSATAADIEELGEKIRQTVKRVTSVDLEWEIKIIGSK